LFRSKHRIGATPRTGVKNVDVVEVMKEVVDAVKELCFPLSFQFDIISSFPLFACIQIQAVLQIRDDFIPEHLL
jgi:hypothetical protein